MRLVWLVLLATMAPVAAAQTGRGEVSGVVLPQSATALAGLGAWPDGPDSARVATVTLTPVRTLACTARPDTDCAPIVVAAQRPFGRYASGSLSMGTYRMRVSAPGCTAVTRPLVILSDARSVEHVALVCERLR